MAGYMATSKTSEWETPQDLFDQLNEEFHFTIDVAASAENAKCLRYFTEEQDGLKQSWAGEVVWCNPPYGEPELPCKPRCKKKKCQKRGHHNAVYIPGIKDWVQKAARESWCAGAVVVMLLPARTDTKWFHRHVWSSLKVGPMNGTEIRFLPGRLKFGSRKDAAPFPSMVVVFSPQGSG